MKNNDTNEDTALILSGSGYNLEISPEAFLKRDEILKSAATVTEVTSNDTSADAAHHMRKLAQMRILVDKSRKEVKEPVIRIGKMIDSMAKEFLCDIDTEEARIKLLIGNHAEAMMKIKLEKEQQERLAFDAARLARLQAEADGSIESQESNVEALKAKLTASEEVAAAKIAQGVSFAWDFEVTDIHMLAELRSDLVKIEPRRAAIIEMFKFIEITGGQVETFVARIGLRAFKTPVVSTR